MQVERGVTLAAASGTSHKSVHRKVRAKGTREVAMEGARAKTAPKVARTKRSSPKCGEKCETSTSTLFKLKFTLKNDGRDVAFFVKSFIVFEDLFKRVAGG